MKARFFYVMLIATLMPAFAYAQGATLSLEKMNALYVGVENPVELRVDSRSCKEYTIVMNGTTFRPSNAPCRFLAFPTIPGRQIAYVRDAKGKTIDSFHFRVKSVPDPVPYLVGKVHGHVNPRLLTGVAVTFDCFDFDYKMQVVSCEVSLKHANEIVGGYKNLSGLFNDDTRHLLENAHQGDVLIVSSIRAGGSDSSIRLLNDLVVVLAW